MVHPVNLETFPLLLSLFSTWNTYINHASLLMSIFSNVYLLLTKCCPTHKKNQLMLGMCLCLRHIIMSRQYYSRIKLWQDLGGSWLDKATNLFPGHFVYHKKLFVYRFNKAIQQVGFAMVSKSNSLTWGSQLVMF